MALVNKKLYETRGHKPQVPDDVEVTVHLRNGNVVEGHTVGDRKLRWEWTDYYVDNKQHLHDIMYFEIV